MKSFTAVTIIYNPNSTGPSKANAQDMAILLQKASADLSVKTMPTKHAGHAESLAYELAQASVRPLVISSSGDGGYHEVVNGIMRANLAGATAVAGLLPSGNANDHYQHMHDDDNLKRIIAAKYDMIDLLLISGTMNGKPWQRYAHSYAGIGLTPHVGKALTKTTLNMFSEKIVTIKAFFKLKPVSIIVNGRRRTYDSLVFSNVQKMAKILKLADRASVHDGTFEVTAVLHKNRVALVGSLLRFAVNRPPQVIKRTSYSFETTRQTAIQLDGEVYTLDDQTTVNVQLVPHALPCII